MRKIALIGFPVVLALFGATIYGLCGRSRLHELELARLTLGTRRGAELLEKMARHYPNDAEVFVLRTKALRMRNQISEALQSLKRAEGAAAPRAAIERERLLLSARSDFSDSEPQLQVLLDQDPTDRDVLLTLALGWLQAKSYKKAESVIKPVLDHDREDGFALCLLGRLHLLQQAPFAARPILERAFGHGPDSYYYADARIMLAECLRQIGDFPKALELYGQSLADEPENTRALLGTGRCQSSLGKWEEATASFQTILRLQPDHPEALSQMAYIHEERGEKQQALELLERAVKHDPTWHELHFRMAKILVALGQNDRAAESLQRAEEQKRYWAKPRSGPDNNRNPYTGDDPTRFRDGTDN